MRRAALVLGLAMLWLVLSDKRDALHLAAGLASAIGVAVSLRVQAVRAVTRADLVALIRYVPWLVGQILISNLRVARLALSRRPAIRPRFIRRTPELEDPRALTLLAMSITLTPGTLTVDIGPGEMLVHALDDPSGLDIEANTMAERIRPIFREAAR
jgi:multisubunit Na+/H+ antiporter MnhE subunit